MPMSTAPLNTSVIPLPEPPPCTSNCTLGWSLVNSSVHTVIIGYNANAPEIATVPLNSSGEAAVVDSDALPHPLNTNAPITNIPTNRAIMFIFRYPLKHYQITRIYRNSLILIKSFVKLRGGEFSLARTEGRRGRIGMLLIEVRRSMSTTLPTSLPTSCFKLPTSLARTGDAADA